MPIFRAISPAGFAYQIPGASTLAEAQKKMEGLPPEHELVQVVPRVGSSFATRIRISTAGTRYADISCIQLRNVLKLGQLKHHATVLCSESGSGEFELELPDFREGDLERIQGIGIRAELITDEPLNPASSVYSPAVRQPATSGKMPSNMVEVGHDKLRDGQ